MNLATRKKERIRLRDVLSADLVTFPTLSERKEVIDLLINFADERGTISDKEAFRTAIFEREEIVSTGIGVGVAVPHAKLECQADFFVCIGVLSKPIDWDSIDKAPVQLVFLIGGPSNAQTDYLQILSQLTQAIKDQGCRRAMLAAKSGDEMLKLFTNEEEMTSGS